MRVLAVAAHPDDIEIACAGTLLKCKAAGHDLFAVTVSNGNMGHKIIPPAELAKIRSDEATRSMKILGAEYFAVGLDDLTLSDTLEQRDRLTALFKEIKPDLIITHSPGDYMPDHVAVSRMVFGAGFTASLAHYPPADAGAAPLAPVAYMDHLAGNGFMPTEYVDISDHIEKKLEMLACHESQLKWMQDHDNIDFREFVRSCSRVRGLQCGTDYAEGFRMCNVWGRVVPRRLLP